MLPCRKMQLPPSTPDLELERAGRALVAMHRQFFERFQALVYGEPNGSTPPAQLTNRLLPTDQHRSLVQLANAPRATGVLSRGQLQIPGGARAGAAGNGHARCAVRDAVAGSHVGCVPARQKTRRASAGPSGGCPT